MANGKTGTGSYPPSIGTIPMLTRIPQGELIGHTRLAPVTSAAEVLHSDAAWKPCTVIAWTRYGQGWAALIRWPSGQEDWREYDQRHFRPV